MIMKRSEQAGDHVCVAPRCSTRPDYPIMSKGKYFLLFYVFIAVSHVSGACERGEVDNVVAFANTRARFKCCSDVQSYYTVNGLTALELDEALKLLLSYNQSTSCSSLSFPAWPEYDMTTVSFVYPDGKNKTFILRVQDLLSKPLNLTSENVNSTHVRIVWDRPPSLMDHNTTRYEGLLTKNGDIVQNITTSAQELIFQRPSPSILLFAVTSINPVGRGGTETLNLTSLSEDCETLDNIAPNAHPFFSNGSIIVEIELFQINEDLYYCIDSVKVTCDKIALSDNYMPVFENGTTIIRLQNVADERHLLIIIYLLSNIYEVKASTYRVQDVLKNATKIQCQFLLGTTENTCFVVLYHDHKQIANFSGSDNYTPSYDNPGTYRLDVYDSKLQYDRGINPAKRLTFVIDIPPKDKPDGDKDIPPKGKPDGVKAWKIAIGPVLGGALLLVVVGVVVMVIVLKRYRRCGDKDPERVPPRVSESSPSVPPRVSESSPSVALECTTKTTDAHGDMIVPSGKSTRDESNLETGITRKRTSAQPKNDVSRDKGTFSGSDHRPQSATVAFNANPGTATQVETTNEEFVDDKEINVGPGLEGEDPYKKPIVVSQ